MKKMSKAEIRAEIARVKREYSAFIRRVGDDMGCDGTVGEAEQYRWDIMSLENDLQEADA